ncbi:hypothetical protein [Limosilactobacillus antri]|uniref:hypothetical protein n=1 Tax=Limosilactobacillus antri TaxID=227943 RepID=UPI001F5ACFE4|nr:hypothetical protein [Limosilactobacillus antri]
MAKKYKIDAVDYEFSYRALIADGAKYPNGVAGEIISFSSAWADFPLGYDDNHKTRGFNPKDGYDYVDNIEELIPPQLTEKDKELLRAEIKKHLIKI